MNLDLRYLDHQRPVFECKARNVVFVKGRRAGGTEGAFRYVLGRMVNEKNLRVLWVDTTHKNISKYVKRYVLPKFRGVPRTRDGNDVWKWNANDKVFSMDGLTGSYMDFGSADRPENLEGHAYDVIVLNEAGIILWDRDLYEHTLSPMGIEGKGAKWLFVGAPKGGNLFKTFKEWGLDPNEKDWAYFCATSYDNPVVNHELIEAAREKLPDAVFRQEYLGEFVDELNFFRNLGSLGGAKEEERAETGIPYLIGLDIARTRDYTVVWVGRPDFRIGVYCERFTGIPWPEQVRRIKAISDRFGHAHCLADATSLGGKIGVDQLSAAGVPCGEYIFSQRSKEELLSALAVDIEQQRLDIIPHEQTMVELRSFQQAPTASGHLQLSAPPGMHDDCVIGLALMNWQFARGEPLTLGSSIITFPGIGAVQENDLAFMN